VSCRYLVRPVFSIVASYDIDPHNYVFEPPTLITVYREIVQAAPVAEAMEFTHGLYFYQA
jgi:hypothetical protein